jgi:hypothetical protein
MKDKPHNLNPGDLCRITTWSGQIYTYLYGPERQPIGDVKNKDIVVYLAEIQFGFYRVIAGESVGGIYCSKLEPLSSSTGNLPLQENGTGIHPQAG